LREERRQRARERGRVAYFAADDDAALERRPRELEELGGAVVVDERRRKLRRPDMKTEHRRRTGGRSRARALAPRRSPHPDWDRRQAKLREPAERSVARQAKADPALGLGGRRFGGARLL